MKIYSFLLFAPFLLLSDIQAQDEWKPAPAPISTRWASLVSPGKAHPEYPRPQMVRADWLNLNGLWDYALRPRQEDRPASFEGKILVPFPVESSLSGVGKRVGPEHCVWYRRFFRLPHSWGGKRILLHFGAVDWEARVWVNGVYLGLHQGGYSPFTLEATAALRPGGDQEILVAAWDPTDAGFQPRGKQVRKPGGIWYTPSTGIWRTVWIEPVPLESIDRLKLTPDLDGKRLLVKVEGRNLLEGCRVEAAAREEGKEIVRTEGLPGKTFSLPLARPRAWSPASPFLYTLEVVLKRGDRVLDRVGSYFGMRKISLGKDRAGVNRLFLNGKPLFHFGTLDQGFWPDGIYTAPTDEALRYDLEILKKYGFNAVRKHVKIEPDRWYFWCDKLGLMVWQDMPSGDRYIGGKDPDIRRVAQSARRFETELKEAVDSLWNHPCLVMWVPFNEGWGQFDTKRIVSWIENYDPTRLVDCASGWTDRGVGHVHDIHAYPGPACPSLEEKRAAVLGEFGGLGLPLPGHTWLREKSWGYRSFKNRGDLTRAYVNLLSRLRLLQSSGLAAAIYTQTTDVEIEVNGLMTYDREILKLDVEDALAFHLDRMVSVPNLHPNGNLFLGKTTCRISNRKGEQIYYTLDGSEPTTQSAKYSGPIEIRESVIVKAKSIAEEGRSSATASAKFEKTTCRESFADTDKLKPGIGYKYYEGQWSGLPNFDSLQAADSGVAAKVDLSKRKRDDFFGFVFSGYIKVKQDGVYTFFTESDDGSRLYIGADLIVDNDGFHGMREESGQVALKAGLHPVKVTFFEGEIEEGLIVRYEGPGVEKKEIPESVLFHQE